LAETSNLLTFAPATIQKLTEMMKEKVALVTGANKGIGFGIAKHLGLNGWKVVIGARNQERAGKAIEELRKAGADVLGWVHIELTDLDDIAQAAKEVSESYPGLTLLVNNAGIPGDMSVDSLHTEIDDIRKTLDVNFIGTFALTKALQPLLAQNEGRIVNITVPSAISPYWHPLAYVTSKAAQNAMMGVMAMEFQQQGTPVEIFSVHPGPTTTDLNGNMSLPGFHDIETVGKKTAELINDGRNHQGEFIELYPIVPED
jgi:NAD(P)-dependent dehydrogenase (short-subunit alcohol dehydrogenase family)